jgi:hypothetical protein
LAGLVPATHEHGDRWLLSSHSCSWVTGIPRFALQPVMKNVLMSGL